MTRAVVLAFALLLTACGQAPSVEEEPAPAALPGQGDDAGRVVLYRDTWGIPHIYAPTVAGGLYAQGYAQAEDRPEQLLVNLKTAMGEYAELAGDGAVAQDLLSRMFDHYGKARTAWAAMEPGAKARHQAFVNGINAFYATHPEEWPGWWRHGEVTGPMTGAFARLFLYSWSISEALGDLARGGVEPGFAIAGRGSNQWAVAPSRSASGDAMLLIDPHLSWWGPSRFWEMRIHADALNGSGVSLPGFPYIGLGHNAHLAWAMTTGGPDTADVYVLKLNPEDPDQYLYDGEWRDLSVQAVSLQVKDGEAQTHRLKHSHHGPILAVVEDVAYAAALPYGSDTDPAGAWAALNFAKDYRGAAEAAATLALFPQNLMAADTGGNIYYQRVGRVPIRPDGYDWSKPVDGSTSATAWQGVHPSGEHLQALNPPQGYMQNCNIPPDAMMVDSPFQLEDHRDYLFASKAYGEERSGWTNQRGARALELLAQDASLTVEEALAIAVDLKPFGVDAWVEALADAMEEPNAQVRALLDWDRQLRRDSSAALKYAYWRFELDGHERAASIGASLEDHYAQAVGRDAAIQALTGADQAVLRETFNNAMARMQAELGSAEAPYGRVFRVGRDQASWPVGGGGGDQFGLTTLRSMGYGAPNDQHERWGTHGQTSTQLVVLSDPIKSWIYLPVGQSDRPASPHYDDQAESAFSPRRMRPSWWLPEDLADHIASRTMLDYSASPDAVN